MENRFVEQLLPYLLAHASQTVSTDFYSRLKRHGISVRRWRLLATLWDAQGLTIGALSRAILVEQSSTTRLVDRAAAEGLVRKAASPSDARRVIVTITQAGRAYIQELVEAAKNADRDLASTLDTARVERLKDELRALINRLDSDERNGVA